MGDEFDLLAALSDGDREQRKDRREARSSPKHLKGDDPTDQSPDDDTVAEVVLKEVEVEEVIPKVIELKEDPEVIESDSVNFDASPKAECLRQITNILSEFRLESNIPLGHRYWSLTNIYRTM